LPIFIRKKYISPALGWILQLIKLVYKLLNLNKEVKKLVNIKSKREIKIMKEACKIAELTQKKVEQAIKPGISTIELDKIAEEFIKSQNAIPAQKNYPHPDTRIKPFPATLCISVNDVVIHGIPDKKQY